MLVVVGSLLIALAAILGSFFVRDALKGRDKISRLDTGPRYYKRNTRALWGLILLAIVCTVFGVGYNR
jgi:hypothetical protein